MDPITYILLPWFLWIFYLAVMNLERARQSGTLSKVALILGIPILIIGLLLDVLVNILIVSVLVLELPREWLVTTRLTRLVRKNNWRGSIARWICRNLLDTFDPSGTHCK